MKIALMGGLGFIGREFTDYAAKSGCTVRVYDMADPAGDDTGCGYEKMDFLTAAGTKTIDADAMVILAAKRPYSGFSFADYMNNVTIADNCFEIAKNSGIKNVVFASSKAVYSDQGTMPWTEELYTQPLSLYGASKVSVEQIALFLNRGGQMNIKCLRFAQVIGLGERKGFLLSTLIDNAIAKKKQVVYGDGSQRRQYVYIKDVCRAILAALEHEEASGVFNIGMPEAISNLELAERINEAYDNAGNLECDLTKPMDTFCDEMDVCRAKRLLEWEPAYDIVSMLVDMKLQ